MSRLPDKNNPFTARFLRGSQAARHTLVKFACDGKAIFVYRYSHLLIGCPSLIDTVVNRDIIGRTIIGTLSACRTGRKGAFSESCVFSSRSLLADRERSRSAQPAAAAFSPEKHPMIFHGGARAFSQKANRNGGISLFLEPTKHAVGANRFEGRKNSDRSRSTLPTGTWHVKEDSKAVFSYWY